MTTTTKKRLSKSEREFNDGVAKLRLEHRQLVHRAIGAYMKRWKSWNLASMKHEEIPSFEVSTCYEERGSKYVLVGGLDRQLLAAYRLEPRGKLESLPRLSQWLRNEMIDVIREAA